MTSLADWFNLSIVIAGGLATVAILAYWDWHA